VIICRRFFTTFSALILLASSVRSVAAAPSFVIVDSQTGYLLQEQDARKKRQAISIKW
jgi:D-alanyl-D-alanine carboxypeptidase